MICRCLAVTFSAFFRGRDGERVRKGSGFLDGSSRRSTVGVEACWLDYASTEARGYRACDVQDPALQQWHTLSDPSARRRCGTVVVSPLLWLAVGDGDAGPRSIWRFRQTIDKLGLSAALLAETNRQLDALGLIVKRGTLVDATLIAAAVKRPPYGGGGINPRDPDARVTMKRKTVHLATRRIWRWTKSAALCGRPR